MPNLEQVFRLSGVPTFTFVKPQRYDEILVSVRTPGRCLVIEGPSGIGKTSVISRVLADLNLTGAATVLSARRSADREMIAALPEMGAIGIVIVDDFHWLDEDTKIKLSDFMKVLADTDDEDSKLILVGINKTGHQLIKFAHDLGLRLDVYRLEANSTELLEELIRLGSEHLNIHVPMAEEIARRAQGSFQLTQLICHKLCVLSGVTETLQVHQSLGISINVVIEGVLHDLSRIFKDVAITFARGSKLRREGRAPYLHILRWLSESDEWSLDLSEAMMANPDMKGSIGQVIDKGHLATLLADPEKSKVIGPYFHYDPSTTVLSVEDPKFIFFLKNLIWRAFTKEAGFKADYFGSRYDFALSFAGANRDLALELFRILGDREVAVFYDEAEQHRIASQNVEDYLAPIYRSEAKYVLVLQSPDYPTRIWTKFESDAFKDRFGQNEVIPIRYHTVQSGFFSDDAKYGGIPFDPGQDMGPQANYICDLLCKRLVEDRQASNDAEAEEATLTN